MRIGECDDYTQSHEKLAAIPRRVCRRFPKDFRKLQKPTPVKHQAKPSASRRPTLKDVALKTRCSTTTVSLVLNDHPLAQRISEATKQRILKAVEDLGYVPNSYAQLLRKSNLHIIGVLCSDITDPFCNQVVQGIMHHLSETNTFYQLIDIQNDESRLQQLFRTAQRQQFDGIIGIVNTMALSAETLDRFIDKKITFVSIGRAYPNLHVPALLVDNREGVRLAICHLYSLGHRRIAFIFGPPQIADSSIRRKAVYEICGELQIPVIEELTDTITEHPPTSEGGARAMRRILRRNQPFSAVFSFDDFTAYGVIQELYSQGLRVPEDVSVVGFDDIWLSKAYNPPLTTIYHPMAELGVSGAKLLIKKLKSEAPKNGAAQAQEIFLRPSLVMRSSTASHSQ